MKSAAETNAKLSESLQIFSIDGEHVETTRYISSDNVTLRIRSGNAAKYAALFKTAHRTFPRGAYKRAGGGRDYPVFFLGMTTAEYCIKFQAMNNFGGAHMLPIDFDALGDRPAALYENGAFDFDAVEEPVDAPEIVETVSLGDRFEAELAKRKAQREALAASEAVAQVVAQAVAAVAISEAMQPVETREVETCQAGDSEASASSMGSASGFAVAAYGNVIAMLANFTPAAAGKNPDFSNDFEENGDAEKPSTTSVAVTGGEATPTVAVSLNFASDIPLSLAVSAYNGTSFSPERRGASAQNEYGQTMAADYETMHAQAVKGGTLALLPEVFARYNARQSSAYRAYLSSSSRCVSSMIAGPANFPFARMAKRHDITHKRLGEYLNGGEMALQAACRTLRPDLRAIMSGDVDAIDRLTIDLNNAERLQNQMKEANKTIRSNAKAGEAHQVAALMEIGYSEAQAVEILHPPAHYGRGAGFPSYRLTNNQANIRRMRARLEQITAAKAKPVQTVECSSGITLEDDAPANRVRLFFPGKPSDEIRAELKSSGFRWAPSVGAWQAYRNHGTLAAAKRMAGEVVQVKPKEDAYSEFGITETAEATPPSMESTETPAPTVAETESTTYADRKAQIDADYSHIPEGNRPPAFIYGEGLEVWEMDYLTFSRQSRGNPHWDQSYSEGDYLLDCLATWSKIVAEHEAQPAQDVPAISLPEVPEVTHSNESAPKGQKVISKSGKWAAVFRSMPSGLFAMFFSSSANYWAASSYETARERMAALQAMARAADAPTDTPPGGEPCPVSPSIPESTPTPAPAVSSAAPGAPVAVSSADDVQAVQIGHKVIKGHNVSWMNNGRVYIGRELFDLLAVDSESFDWVAKTPREFDAICAIIAKPSAGDAPRYPRNVIPSNGLHIVEDAFEAWTFTSGERFAFVMYLGKSAKPWKYFGYPTEAKRDAGFDRYATDARAISTSKANQKLAAKAQSEKPHGLQVGDVVRSSWGYEQTNVNHYQIVSVIGKRTVEVRELAEHEETTGDMTGRVAPVHGDFVGEAKRCTVDKWGQVNVRGKDYGRASKIEPIATVHGVRCYAASSYSSYA